MVDVVGTSTQRKTIGITGANGLLGRHLRAFLRSDAKLRVISATRASFATAEEFDPVVVSDCPPMSEFAGDAATYFDPTSPQDLADKLAMVLEDPVRRGELAE
jgi:glycosyltransferase involved in cell wall biosynthesis